MEVTREYVLTAIESAERGPPTGDLTAAPKLDPWRVELWGSHYRLYGECANHPEIDEPYVTTSPLLALNFNAGWARTRSRWYLVGENIRVSGTNEKDEMLAALDHALGLFRSEMRRGLLMLDD